MRVVERISKVSLILVTLTLVLGTVSSCDKKKDESETEDTDEGGPLKTGDQPGGDEGGSEGSGADDNGSDDGVTDEGADDGDDGTATSIETVFSVNLSATGSPTAMTCFALTATGIGEGGSEVLAAEAVTFTLDIASGSGGAFYSNPGCTTVITEATIAQEAESTTVYYKTGDQGAIILTASLNGMAGGDYNTTLYGPTTTSLPLVYATGNTDCRLVSLQMYGNGGLLVQSQTMPTTITLTQTVDVVTGEFYEASDCSGATLTVGNVTEVTIPAGSTNKTLYFLTGGNAGYFHFEESYTCDMTTVSGYESFIQM